jgi:hypothetical protein
MRLIDANALKCKVYYHKLDGRTRSAVTINDIENAPTMNAVPVVWGEWDESGTGSPYCSKCLSSANLKTNHCPHCGARMDFEGCDI